MEQFCDAGADLVTVHVESDTQEKLQDAIARIHAKGKRAGVVLKPEHACRGGRCPILDAGGTGAGDDGGAGLRRPEVHGRL